MGTDPFFQASSVPVRRYDQVVAENSALKLELEQVKRQVVQEQHRQKSGNPFESGHAGGTGLGAPGTAAALLADNERLNSEKEELTNRLRRADQEKREICTNFSYLKSQYDKLSQAR